MKKVRCNVPLTDELGDRDVAVAGRRIDVVVVNKEDGGIAVAGRWVYASEGKKQGDALRIQNFHLHCSTSTCFVTCVSRITHFARRIRRVPPRPSLPTRTRMAFRRFAQENYAASNSPTLPTTPRNRPVIISPYRSPAATPSISSSIPFDWEAARSRKSPPYATPFRNRTRRSTVTQTPGSQPRKAIVRKKGLVER